MAFETKNPAVYAGGGSGADGIIGIPSDGSWADGLMNWDPSTLVKDAIDDINEILLAVAPQDASGMSGSALSPSGVTMYQGRLSADNVNYKPGSPAGSAVSYIIIDTDFSLFSPNQSVCFNKADTGMLSLEVNGIVVDSFDLSAQFSNSERTGNQSYPPASSSGGSILVTFVGVYNSFPLWQRGNCSLHITDSLLRQGWNCVRLLHTGGMTAQATAAFDIFWDKGTVTSTVSIPTVVELMPSFKYLSGIKYYFRGSAFNLSLVASNVFDNTYHIVSPVAWDSTAGSIGSGTIDYDDLAVSGVNWPPKISDASMIVTDKVISVPNSNVRSMDACVTAVSRKPWCLSNSAKSVSQNRMIDAFAITSNELNEYFDDEDRRLPIGGYNSIPAVLQGQWNSQALLSSGNAQVHNGMLIFPTINFSTGYLPNGTQPDYSSFSGDQRYCRAFIQGGYPHSSGKLQVNSLFQADVSPVGSGSVNIELKLPGQTGWLDLGKPFDSGTFTGADGDGCQVTVANSDFSWTCGTFTTANSGWMYVLRVTMRDQSRQISQIREVGW